MYYIEHELQAWPGESGLRITPGEWEYLRQTTSEEETLAARLGSGWSHIEDNGRWTDGNEARIWYQLTEEEQLADYKLTLDVTDSVTPQPVRVYAGTIYLGEIPPEQRGEIVFNVPGSSADAEGLLAIRLEIEETVVPASGRDDRDLGIKVSRIQIEKDGAEGNE